MGDSVQFDLAFLEKTVQLRSVLNPASFLVTFVVTMTLYALYLCDWYNNAWGPFYDSVSYMNVVAVYHWQTLTDGFLPTITSIIKAQDSTVLAPWLITAVLSAIGVPLSRWYAVFILLPLYLLMLAAGFLFFRRYARYDAWRSAIFSALLVSFAAIFNHNGGLYDLRMDLAQALTWGAACAFLAIARSTMRLRDWLLFGAISALACLFRATTPVYLTGYALIAVFDLAFSDRRAAYLRGYASALGLFLLLSMPFFVYNYDYLFFYYVVWNDDAQSYLPLSESVMHLHFIVDGIGRPAVYAVAGLLLINLLRIGRWQNLAGRVNWVALIGFAVPAAFLVFQGAGLNPFVSMLAVPPLLMFALAPVASSEEDTIGRMPFAAVALLAAVFVVTNLPKTGMDGVQNWRAAKPQLLGLVDKVIAQAEAQPKPVQYVVIGTIGAIDRASILNAFIYERGWKPADGKFVVTNGQVTIDFLDFAVANTYDWLEKTGRTDGERAEQFAVELSGRVDILVSLTDGSYINPFHRGGAQIPNINRLIIEKAKLKPVSEPIAVSAQESFVIFAR